MLDTRKKNIAVLMSATDDNYEMRFINGIYQCASSHNANVCVFMSYGGYDIETRHNAGEYNIYNLPDLSRYDGIILIPNLIAPADLRTDMIARIRSSGTPYVIIDYHSPDVFDNDHNIYTDNSLPVFQIVEHLITVHGMHRINFVTGPAENTESNERFQGYCEALKKYDIPLEECRIFHGTFTGDCGSEAVRSFIRQDREGICSFPEAIVFGNDISALYGATELIHNGYRIPEDVAVTGYDDIELARRFSPCLTTVSRPVETLSFHACEKILQMADGITVDNTDYYSAYPVFRESCGCHSSYEPETYSQFRFRQFEQYLSTSRNSSLIPIMTRDLFACEDFQDYYRKLTSYASQIECEGFYLCLDPEFKKALPLDNAFLTSGYAESMTVPVALTHGQPTLYPDFGTIENFPALHQHTGQAGLYFFLPIHYQELCFGYLVLHNSQVMFTNQFFNSWLITVSGSLENLRRQKLLKSIITELDSKYIKDSLTGLYNRFGFTRHAREALSRSGQEKRSLSVVFMDLDSLKHINDEFGHDEGDFVIIQFAQTLIRLFPEDIVCRFGGDEFVILSEESSSDALHHKLRRLNVELRRLSADHSLPYTIQTSFGLYIREPGDTATIEECVIRADKKMYAQKRRKHHGRSPSASR